jgi:hypothetical protein
MHATLCNLPTPTESRTAIFADDTAALDTASDTVIAAQKLQTNPDEIQKC